MNPTTNQVSMQEYASENDRYKSMPNEEQTRAGVVPLDSLPAAWWNALWEIVTKNNNAILFSVADLRTEIGNALTAAGITADAHTTNQLATAIFTIHKKTPYFENNNPVPGSVISSSDRNSASVGNDGKMIVNALSDWASQDSVKTVISDEATARQNADSSLSQAISDEATARQNADGTLANLTTTDKTDLVAAINEVDSHADSNAQAISDEATARQNADGTLANLTTTDKTDLVAAINEVNDKANPVQYSTSEFDTKKKWIDGKKIYGRVLDKILFNFIKNTGMPYASGTDAVISMAVYNNKLYLVTYGRGIYTTSDGVTFTHNTSFPNRTVDQTGAIVFNNKLYVGTSSSGIYVSSDGDTFTQNTSFPVTAGPRQFVIFNNTLYVTSTGSGNNQSIFKSTDGSTFTRVPVGVGVVSQMAVVFNNKLYIGSVSGIFVSSDGSSFAQNTSFPTSGTVAYRGYVFNNKLYVGTSSSGIYVSSDGDTFTQNTSFPTDSRVNALCGFNGYLFAASFTSGIYISSDGNIFTQDASFPITDRANSLQEFNNVLYTGATAWGLYQVDSLDVILNISELLFTQLRNSAGPLGLKSAHINSSNHLVVEGDGTPTQAIIEYTKTT